MATHSPTVSGKRVSDLRVTELRLELEQRGLETKGLKADLVKRLEKALAGDEGGTPGAGTPLSNVSENEEKTRSRKSTPRRREPKGQAKLKQAAVEVTKAGGPELNATAADNSLDYTAHKEGSDVNEGVDLSESLFVNASESMVQDFDAGEMELSEANPDQYFKDDAYVQENVSTMEDIGPVNEEENQIKTDDQEFEYADEEGDNDADEVLENNDEEYYEPEEGMDETGEMINEDEEMFNEEGDIDEGDDQYRDVEEVEDEEQFIEGEEEDYVEGGEEEDYVEGDAENLDEENIMEAANEEEEEEEEEEQFYEDDNPGEIVEDTEENAGEGFEHENTGIEVHGDKENKNELEEAINEVDVQEDQEAVVDTEDNQENLEENHFEFEVLKDKELGEDLECDINEEAAPLDKGEVSKEEESESVDARDDMDESTDIQTKREKVLIDKEVSKEDTNDVKVGESEDADSKGKLGLEEVMESKMGKSEVADTSSTEKEPAAAERDVKTDKESSKPDDKDAKKQPEKDEKKEIIRSVWISGLSSVTRAVDLKTTFSKYGKVVGAKVVTSARSPGTNCFGFVTMSSFDEASKCIENLNKTEIHGKVITVERAKHDPTPKKPPPKQDKKVDEKKTPQKSSKQQKQGSSSKKEETKDVKSSESNKKVDTKDAKARNEKKKDDRSRSDSKSERRASDRRRRSRSRSRHRSRSRDHQKQRSHHRSKSREKRKTVDSADSKSTGEGSDKKFKSLDALKKERQAKIEKDRKLREERRKKERDRERELREERRKAQEARERERRERAKKEEERIRRERERQREIERERDLRKKRERERLAQERRDKEREREEKERLERERKEREAQLERDRLERERLKEEREERERIEKERMERERKERERVERERLRREKEELERIRAERERLERERLEVERRYALKRAGPPGKRELDVVRNEDRYIPDQKKQALESPKGQGGRPRDFFGGSHVIRDGMGSEFSHVRPEEKARSDLSAHSDYSSGKRDGGRHSSRDEGHNRSSLSRSGREPSPLSYSTGRGRERSPISAHSGESRRTDSGYKDDRRDDHSSRDYRRIVSSRDERDRSPRRSDILRDVDRSRLSDVRHSDKGSSRSNRRSSRDGDGIQFYDMEEKPRDHSWPDSPELRSPPKTLNEILERAGVRGILGSASFDQKLTMTVNDALSLAASRAPKSDSTDWRGDPLDDRRDERRGESLIDRREIRRDERHDRRDDRRDERLDIRRDDRRDDRLSASARDIRIGQDPIHRETESRHPIGFSRSDAISRSHEIDLGMSRRAQELLAQAGIPDARSRIPPSQQMPSRNIVAREPMTRELPREAPRDSIDRGYQQRGPEPHTRDSYPRNIARGEINTRGFPTMSSIQQQVLPARQHPTVPSRPSSQDSWNRSRNVVPTLGAPGNFQLPGTLIGSSPLRRETLPPRGMSKPGIPEHGIPSHIRRF